VLKLASRAKSAVEARTSRAGLAVRMALFAGVRYFIVEEAQAALLYALSVAPEPSVRVAGDASVDRIVPAGQAVGVADDAEAVCGREEANRAAGIAGVGRQQELSVCARQAVVGVRPVARVAARVAWLADDARGCL